MNKCDSMRRSFESFHDETHVGFDDQVSNFSANEEVMLLDELACVKFRLFLCE